MKRLIIASALTLFLSTTYAADAFTDAMQQAYAPYRVALFKTNNGTPDEATKSVQQAKQAWKKVTDQFSAQPPAPYDRDEKFAATLETVMQVYNQAEEQATQKQLAKSHETLEKVREALADLRHRNQVIIYSDHMNAYHSVMEQILEENKKILAESDGIQQLTAKAGVLIYLSEKLRTEAPEQYRNNAEFTKLIDSQKSSVDALREALFKNDAPAIHAAITKLKMPYSKLFLKFG